jgi:photosystem II stability/assembly factor-like uncharacterized protein
MFLGVGRPAEIAEGAALKAFLVCSLVLLFFGFQTALADWLSLGPEGGEVRHVIQSTLDANTLYGFSDSYATKVVRSTDGGTTWTSIGSFNNQEYSVAMNAAGTIYAGGGSAFFYSTSGGTTWTQVSTSNTYWYGLATHPTVSNTLFGTGYRYNGSTWVLCFMKSTTGGASWTYTDIGAADTYGQAISVSQTDPNVIFITGYAYTGTTDQPIVYRSIDGGSNWTDVTPAAAATDYLSYSIAVSPTDKNLVLLGTYYNMWRSTDCGASWTNVAANQYYNYSLVFSKADPNTVFAGGYNYVYRSTNAGLNWTSYSTGLPAQYLNTVTPHRTDVTKVYTGTTVGFYRSTTTGTSWAASNSGLYLGKVYAFGVAPSQPSKIYMQMYGLGIWLSTNNGSAWTHLVTPLSCGDFCGIVVKTTDPNTVLALEGSG